MYYDSSSALFWYKIVFLFELLIAEFLFTWRLKKKKLYPVRFLVVAIVSFGIDLAIPIIEYNALYSSLLFFGLYLLTSTLLKLFVYEEKRANVFFCTLAAYTSQHLAFEFYNFIIVITDLNNGLPVQEYGDKMQQTYDALVIFIHYESYLIAYWLCYLFFARKVRKGEDMNPINIHLLFISIASLMVIVFINAVATYYSYKNPSRFYSSLISLVIIFCCVFILTAQFNLLDKKKATEEAELLQKMLSQEEKQYAMLKENIDYINIKCHDLKHQIRHFGKEMSIDDASIKEMVKTASIYDTSLKTGNSALDILLMEKNLTCMNNEIKFTTMADGSLLSFMNESEIYSLLGNGIDNAIESLNKIEDKEKRVMGLIIKEANSFISIHLYNYCEKAPDFKDGLPITTKDNSKKEHGYGFKSMRLIVENYDGSISASFDKGIFSVDMLFPLKK